MARPKGTTKKHAKLYALPRARVTAKDYFRIKWLVREYAGGNWSRWLVHAALEAPRKYLK